MFKLKLKIQQYAAKRNVEKIKNKVSRMATHSSLTWTISATLFKMFVLLFFGTLILLPFIYMIMFALMSDGESLAMQDGIEFTFIPKDLMWENFSRAFKDGYFQAFINTLIVTTLSIVARIIITAFAGYGFAYKKWHGKKTILAILLGLMMIPEVALIISQFRVVVNLKLESGFGVYIAMMLPYISSVMSIFMFRDAFTMVSDRIQEASAIDGCGGGRFFWKIAFPMVRPTLWTVAILTAFASWNSYMWPALITTGDESKYVLSIWMFDTGRIVDANGNTLYTLRNLKMAASVLVMLPTMTVYLIFRRRIMDAVGKRGSTVKG